MTHNPFLFCSLLFAILLCQVKIRVRSVSKQTKYFHTYRYTHKITYFITQPNNNWNLTLTKIIFFSWRNSRWYTNMYTNIWCKYINLNVGIFSFSTKIKRIKTHLINDIKISIILKTSAFKRFLITFDPV